MRENFALPVLSVTAELGVETLERACSKAAGPEVFLSEGQASPMNLTDSQLMARFNDDFFFAD